jgi:hypothetical protein
MERAMSDGNSFYIQWSGPCEPHWPQGAWSVYQIDGDQIANRVVRERVNPNGYYEGKVIARHSWCGYLGMFKTLSEVMAAIEAAKPNDPADKRRAPVSR